MSKATKTTTALMALLMGFGTKAIAENKTVSIEQLEKSCITPELVEKLLAAEIMAKTPTLNVYEINTTKIDELLAHPENQQLTDYLNFIKSIVGDDVQVEQKSPCQMTLGTQDIMISK